MRATSHLQSRHAGILNALAYLAFPVDLRHDARARKESPMPAEATDTSDRIAAPALLPHWLILGSVTLPGQPAYVREARRLVAAAVGADHPRADTVLLLT